MFNKIRTHNLARLPAQHMLAHRFEARLVLAGAPIHTARRCSERRRAKTGSGTASLRWQRSQNILSLLTKQL